MYDEILLTFNRLKNNMWNFLSFIPKYTSPTPQTVDVKYVGSDGIERVEQVPNLAQALVGVGGTEEEFIETLTNGTIATTNEAEGDLAQALVE